jgi:hypothetical protein
MTMHDDTYMDWIESMSCNTEGSHVRGKPFDALSLPARERCRGDSSARTHADAAGKDEQHRVVQGAVCCAAHRPRDTHRHHHTRRQLPRHLLHAQNLCACSWAHSMHGCTPKHSSDAVNTVGSRPPRRQHCA